MEPVLVLTVFLVSLTSGVEHIGRQQIIYGVLHNVTHDPKSELCCNGIISRKDVQNAKCCGSTTYNPVKQKCCDGVVHPRSNNLRCCKNLTYDKTTQFCCLNLDTSYPSGKYGFFSDLSIMDKNDQQTREQFKFCCGGQLVADRRTTLCCGQKLFENPSRKLRCCGPNKAYEYRKEMCCYIKNSENVILNKTTPENSCCNGETYNPKKHKCCGGKLMEIKEENSRCCLSKLVDSKTHGCCNGKIYEREKEFCCLKIVRNKQDGLCCGRGLHNKFYPGVNWTSATCCGPVLIYPRDVGTIKEKCCGRSLVDDPRVKECCGFYSYNPEKEECCDLDVVPIRADGKSSCCKITSFVSDLKKEKYTF